MKNVFNKNGQLSDVYIAVLKVSFNVIWTWNPLFKKHKIVFIVIYGLAFSCETRMLA